MSISLKDHIAGSIRSLKVALVVCSGVASFVVTFMLSIYFSVDSDRATIHAARSYLVGLVASNDRPDTFRILESIAVERDRQLTLVVDGMVFADTFDLERVDQTYSPNKDIAFLGAKFLRGGRMEHAVSLSETPNLYVVMEGQVWPMLWSSLAVSIVVALMILAMMYLINRAISRALDHGLKPLSDLVRDVSRIGTEREIAPQEPALRIEELQEIRSAIELANRALLEAQNRLAESKAKELTANAFQSLIHDLHTPVTTLHAWVGVLQESDLLSKEDKDAIAGVLRLAEQILRQVTAGRKNLEIPESGLMVGDLRDTVSACISQVQSARPQSSIAIEPQFLAKPIIALHDSSAVSRAIVNLLENAVDAAESKVCVDLAATMQGVVVRIEDDGPGISPEAVAKFIWGRGVSERKGRQAFGLSSAAHIARAHSGRIIHRNSKALGGACFELQLGVQ